MGATWDCGLGPCGPREAPKGGPGPGPGFPRGGLGPGPGPKAGPGGGKPEPAGASACGLRLDPSVVPELLQALPNTKALPRSTTELMPMALATWPETAMNAKVPDLAEEFLTC